MDKKLKDLPPGYKFGFPLKGYDELNIKVVNLRTYDDANEGSGSYEYELKCIKQAIDNNCGNFKNCIWFYSGDAAPPSKSRTYKGLFYRDNNYEKFPMVQKEVKVAENRSRIYALVELIPEYINRNQTKLLNWYNGFILLTNDGMSVVEKYSELWNRKSKNSFSVDYKHVAEYLTSNPSSVAMRYFPAHNYKGEKLVLVSHGSLTDFKLEKTKGVCG